MDSGPVTAPHLLPVTGYSYVVWLTAGVVLLAAVLTVGRQCWVARRTAVDDDYTVLIEKSGNDWQSKSTHQLPLPRAFQL